MTILRNNIREIIICLFTFFILSLFPGTVTGIHFDEAWILFSAKNIAHGELLLNGMNNYTGALQQYILLPFFSIFGYTIEVMRLVNAVINTFSLFFLIYTVKTIHPEKNHHIWFGIVMCIFPVFVTISRFAVEISSINFLLTCAGIFFISKAIYKGRDDLIFSTISGLSFGLASYNHMISLAPPFAILISLLLFYGKELFKRRALLFFGLGFLLGFAPRIISYILIKESITSNSFILSEIIKDIPNLPLVLINILDGSLIFLRFSGENLIPVIPYFSSTVLILLWIKICFIKGGMDKKDKVILAAFFIITISIVLITPRFSIRYFLIPILFAPYLLVRLTSSLWESDKVLLNKLGTIAISFVIFLNGFYLTSNYFVSFILSGGKIKEFNIGRRLTEKSSHFVLTDKLYDQLINKKVKLISSDIAIAQPLLYHDMEKKTLRVIDEKLVENTNRLFLEKSAIIYYNPVDLPEAIYYKKDNRIIKYLRNWDFDPKFAVFLSE